MDLEGHPIEGLIKTAMESIKEMVNVNTIVGDAVETPDGTVIIPVSKVTFGFAAGGGEFVSKNTKGEDNNSNDNPFAGGSGAGVSVQPVAFMIVSSDNIKLMPVSHSAMLERVIDLAPEIIDKISKVLSHDKDEKQY